MAEEMPINRPIDSHCHIVPSSLVEEAKRSGRSLGIQVEDTPQGAVLTFPGIPTLRPVTRGHTSLEDRLQWMDREGIGKQILASWLDVQGYSLPAEEAAIWARVVNEHLAQQASQDTERFRAMATVPLQDGEMAARELEYAVTSLGMIATMVAADPASIDLSHDSMEPFWAAAAALDVPVVIHPATHGPGAITRPIPLTFIMGRTFDTTVTSAKLILSGLLDRHPNLKLVLVHGGGYLPYQIGRLDNGYETGAARTVELQRGLPSSYLPLMYYDTVSMGREALRLLLDVAGAKHMMIGSDFVAQAGDEHPIERVKQVNPTPEEFHFMCCGTAQSLYLGGQ